MATGPTRTSARSSATSRTPASRRGATRRRRTTGYWRRSPTAINGRRGPRSRLTRAGGEVTATAAFEAHRISRRTVFGLVVAIAATDVVANVLAPEDSKVPLKLAIAAGFVAWARWPAHLSWDELGFGRAHLREGLRFGAWALLAIGVVIAVLVAVPGSRSYFDVGSVAADSTAQRVLQPLLFIPLGTVVFEEV